MRDQDHRAAARNFLQVGLQDGLAFRVERTCCLIEDQQARPDQQGARDGKPLALPARKIHRTFLDHGFITQRQPLDEFVGTGKTRGLDDRFEPRLRIAGGDIVADGAAEQETVLQDYGDVAAQMGQIDIAYIGAAQPDRAGLRLFDSPSCTSNDTRSSAMEVALG